MTEPPCQCAAMVGRCVLGEGPSCRFRRRGECDSEYWKRLAAEIGRWKPVADSDVSMPEPML